MMELSGDCRARLDCTYVQSDLALHTPQNKPMVSNNSVKNIYLYYFCRNESVRVWSGDPRALPIEL